MFEAVGAAVRVRPAMVDDSVLEPGRVGAEHWVMALAYMKARWVNDALLRAGEAFGTVLAADTVCVHGDEIFGQPSSADDARRMLLAMRGAAHVTITGVCLISLADSRRWMFVDQAVVRCGHVNDGRIEQYIASGQWRGKAGAYNLQERIDEGWPIECDGDPDTVMGLPMRCLEPWLTEVRERDS